MGFTLLGLFILGLFRVLDPIVDEPIGNTGPVGYVESYKEGELWDIQNSK